VCLQDNWCAYRKRQEENRSLVRPWHRLACNIKMAVTEVEWGGIGLIDLAQDRDMKWTLVNAVMNLPNPYNARNVLTC
jgi:hypothetical protein